ncbi:PTS fructose transporter subunit IIABC [Williamsoniiplasma lucivorax]|uniref:PTS system, fructose-specific IIABC component n=1 Tax=Williamsoniiplasma lucivorax TaxID=209274 RepID=A0A2S5R9Y9_9MOLU|nr:fructose-specific PTS transporter subunit EIIC [Williamsoniiplasma lucivorax]PPE04141.1 PTS system, fructose-specific IIABC component [Williamsoniiplasma lucivorax]
MELQDLFNKEISFFEEDLKSKDEVINFLTKKLKEQKFIKSMADFKTAIYKRESEASTGVGDGISIPHVLNKTVLKSAIAFVKLKNKIDWQALDNQPVDLVFMIMTNGEDGDEHLTALAGLSGFLMKPEVQTKLRKAKSIKDLKTIFTHKEEKKEIAANGHYDVIGITACPTGIAHTYMAAEKLEEYAKSLGMTVKIETQGRRGIENKLTQDDINHAKVIILAHDKALEGLSRLNGKQVIDTHTKDAIFNGTELITKFATNKNLKTIQAVGGHQQVGELTLKKFLDFKGNLLGGISRMLPFVVAGGIILGIGFLIDFAIGNGSSGGDFGVQSAAAGWFSAIGKLSMSMMVPILGGYIAYSIVGVQGLMPGILAGLFSSNIMGFAYGGAGAWDNLWGKLIPGFIVQESGFIGAIIGAYLAALYVYGWTKAMNKFPKSLAGVRDIVFIPVVSLLSIAITMFVLNIPLGYLMGAISDGIKWLAAHDLILIVSTLIGFMMCVDMGGPVNKIAYSLGVLSVGGKLVQNDTTHEQTIIMAASMLAGMLPPLMIAMSTIIFPKTWTAKDRDAAKANWLMGACFISEGAIPFMVKDPKRVAFSAMLGGAIIGLLVGLLKIKLGAPHGGIFVFALLNTSLIDGGTLTSASIGVGIGVALSILIGSSLISATVLGLWRSKDIKKGKLTLDSTNGVKENLELKIKHFQGNLDLKNAEEKLKNLKEKLTKYKNFELELKAKQTLHQQTMLEKERIRAEKKAIKANQN